MSKIIPFILATCTLLIIGVPLTTHAGDTINIQLESPTSFRSVAQVLNAFFKVLVQLGAVAVTLALVYAGFMFVVAQGRPEQLKTARETLFWTIIGALVLLGAQVIANIIESTIRGVETESYEGDVNIPSGDSSLMV